MRTSLEARANRRPGVARFVEAPSVEPSNERRVRKPIGPGGGAGGESVRTLYNVPGSVYGAGGDDVPPVAGKNAILRCVSPPIWSVSLPTHRPAGVATMATPAPVAAGVP